MTVPRRVAALSARLVVIILAASHEPALSRDTQSILDEESLEAGTGKFESFSVDHLREITAAGRTSKIGADCK